LQDALLFKHNYKKKYSLKKLINFEVVKSKLHANLYKPKKRQRIMGFTAVQIKIMPDSPSADLKAIEKAAEETIVSMHKTSVKFEEEPIAFGLSAIMLSFAWNDEIELEQLEAKLQEIINVSSVEVTDIRKAFG
jgi:translation elongation factor aEF-1 beta